MTDANPEPAAVQASGQRSTSSAPLGGGTTAELPADAAREGAPSITADSARNGSPARAGSTGGKTSPCTACVCVCVCVQRGWQGTKERAVHTVVQAARSAQQRLYNGRSHDLHHRPTHVHLTHPTC